MCGAAWPKTNKLTLVLTKAGAGVSEGLGSGDMCSSTSTLATLLSSFGGGIWKDRYYFFINKTLEIRICLIFIASLTNIVVHIVFITEFIKFSCLFNDIS